MRRRPGVPRVWRIGGWAPGADPRREEPETALPVPKNADLVVQIHYHPSGKVEQDRSTLGTALFRPAHQRPGGHGAREPTHLHPAGQRRLRRARRPSPCRVTWSSWASRRTRTTWLPT